MDLYREYFFIGFFSDDLRLRYCTIGHVRRVRPTEGMGGWVGGGEEATCLYYVRGGDRCPAIVYESGRRAHENIINTFGSAAFRVCNLAACGSRTRPTGASVGRSAVFASFRERRIFFKFFLFRPVKALFRPPTVNDSFAFSTNENSVVLRYVRICKRNVYRPR